MRKMYTNQGEFFGYIKNNYLYTYKGKSVGKLEGKDIFNKNGEYIGSIDYLNYLGYKYSNRKKFIDPWDIDDGKPIKVEGFQFGKIGMLTPGYSEFPSVEDFD